MTVQKDFKRLVRARMEKTGEAYTAARAQLLSKAKPKTIAVGSPEGGPHTDYAALAGFSDKTIKEKTGCTWDRWVPLLDYLGADTMSHREIAALVNTKFKIDGWWSQAVTIGYERIKRRRAIGQRLDGKYEAAKSRTFNVPVAVLFSSWADSRKRRRWMNGTKVTLRTATSPKSVRLGMADGTIVAAWFMDKGNGRSAVSLAHMKLPDKLTADRVKQFWTERLDALGETLRA